VKAKPSAQRSSLSNCHKLAYLISDLEIVQKQLCLNLFGFRVLDPSVYMKASACLQHLAQTEM